MLADDRHALALTMQLEAKTRAEIAEHLGVSVNTIADWRRRDDYRTELAIANRLRKDEVRHCIAQLGREAADRMAGLLRSEDEKIAQRAAEWILERGAGLVAPAKLVVSAEAPETDEDRARAVAAMYGAAIEVEGIDITNEDEGEAE